MEEKVRRKRLLGGIMTAGRNEAVGGTKYNSKTLSLTFQKNYNIIHRNEEKTLAKL